MSLKLYRKLFEAMYNRHGKPMIYVNGVSREDKHFLSENGKEYPMTDTPLKSWVERIHDSVHKIIKTMQHDTTKSYVVFECDRSGKAALNTPEKEYYDICLSSPSLWWERDGHHCERGVCKSSDGQFVKTHIANHCRFKPYNQRYYSSSARLKQDDGVHCAYFDSLEVGLHVAFMKYGVHACFLSPSFCITRYEVDLDHSCHQKRVETMSSSVRWSSISPLLQSSCDMCDKVLFSSNHNIFFLSNTSVLHNGNSSFTVPISDEWGLFFLSSQKDSSYYERRV